MTNREVWISASELAQSCVCERQVIFDRAVGARRSPELQRLMHRGEEAHLRMHRQSQGVTEGDARCFIATALWGAGDARTCTLRAWRDRWLLARPWGQASVALYYAISPLLVRPVRGSPVLRWALSRVLSFLVHWLRAKGF